MKNRSDRKSVDEIIRILRDELPQLRERCGVRSLGIFGSYLRGEQGRRSALDVLVEFDERPLTLLGFAGLENYLSDRIGLKVDLVGKSTLKPAIGRRILEQVKPIRGRKPAVDRGIRIQTRRGR